MCVYYWSFLYGAFYIPAFTEIMEIRIRISVSNEWISILHEVYRSVVLLIDRS